MQGKHVFNLKIYFYLFLLSYYYCLVSNRIYRYYTKVITLTCFNLYFITMLEGRFVNDNLLAMLGERNYCNVDSSRIWMIVTIRSLVLFPIYFLFSHSRGGMELRDLPVSGGYGFKEERSLIVIQGLTLYNKVSCLNHVLVYRFKFNSFW